MDVTSATTAASATSSTTTDDSTAGASVISSDFETFLKMLTVQMENQDPLNPIESSDFAVQLATFSGVEQQVQTNDLLEGLNNQISLMTMSDMASWVGMEVRAATSAQFELAPISVNAETADGATSAYMVVYDSSGLQVDRFEIDPNGGSIDWAGLDAYGNLLPEGDYSFAVQSYDNEGVISEDPVTVYSKVVEAQVVNGETMLVLASGDQIAASAVDAVRQGDSQ